jgi:hypothetical protein
MPEWRETAWCLALPTAPGVGSVTVTILLAQPAEEYMLL